MEEYVSLSQQKSQIFEGITHQYIRALVNAVPVSIQCACRDDMLRVNLEGEISRIAKEYLVKVVGEGDVVYEIPTTPELGVIDKISKRKKYQSNVFINELTEDYQSALNGGTDAVMKPYSPFIEISILDKMKGGRSRAEVVEEIFRGGDNGGIEGYIDRLGKFTAVREGMAGFVAFSEFEYFNLLVRCNPKRAGKLLTLDIEEAALRLSFEEEFKSYASYMPASFGKGFFSENKKAAEGRESDMEYQEMSERYIHETFFPDIANVAHAQIVSDDPWGVSDYEIFKYLVTKGISGAVSFRAGDGVLRVEGTINELVTRALGKKRASKNSESVHKHLLNILNTHLVALSGNNGDIIGKALFDKFYIGKDVNDREGGGKGETHFKAEFGNSITKDIVSSYVNVSVRPLLEELSSITRFLYTEMKRDRARDLLLFRRESHLYTLTDFIFIIRVKESQKSKRVARYVSALQEMRDKGILIKDFHVSGTIFSITWLDLNEEERKDIKFLQNPYKDTDMLEEQ